MWGEGKILSISIKKPRHLHPYIMDQALRFT